jgi:hypothetical protein
MRTSIKRPQGDGPILLLPKKIPKAASDNQVTADGHSFPTTAKKPPPDMAEVKRALADVVRDLREVCTRRPFATTALQCFLE